MRKPGLEVESTGSLLVVSRVASREEATGVNGIQYDHTVVVIWGGGRPKLPLIAIDYTASVRWERTGAVENEWFVDRNVVDNHRAILQDTIDITTTER